MAQPVSQAPLFREPETRSEFPRSAVLIATGVILVLTAVLLLLSRHKAHATNEPLPLASYAPQLTISDVHMSESESLSGGKSTYIDGNIVNNGSATVTAITVQTLFRNDEVLPPQIETGPLLLVRTHEPYIDTEPISAEPLTPGAKHEFRLTFEGIGLNWNQQVPEVRAVSVSMR